MPARQNGSGGSRRGGLIRRLKRGAADSRLGREHFLRRRDAPGLAQKLSHFLEELPDVHRVLGFPGREVLLHRLGGLQQQIDAAKQQIDLGAAQLDFSFLRGDEAIFHFMGDAGGGLQIHDPRGAFQRVGGAQQSLEQVRRRGLPFQLQQPGRQDGRLILRFEAEQLDQGTVEFVQEPPVHVKLRLRVENSKDGSSNPTIFSCHENTPRVNVKAALVIVVGGAPTSSA